MTRVEFTSFVERTIEGVVRLAEQKAGRKLSRNYAFQWLGQPSSSRVTNDIPAHIVERIFIDEEHIYPCVDIGVGDQLQDGSLLIVASVAGYAPRPFGKNWTGRDGPFIYIVGQPFLNRIAGRKVEWSPEKGIFHYISPDQANLI
jgi:hypothetical protein